MKKLVIAVLALVSAASALSAAPALLNKTSAGQKATLCSVFLYKLSLDTARQRPPGAADPQDPVAQSVAVGMLLAKSLATKATPLSEARAKLFIEQASALSVPEQESLTEYCADLAEYAYGRLSDSQKDAAEESARQTLLGEPRKPPAP